MTDTQKAQEIAKVHEVHYDRFHGETSNDECFLSALEMAEWKDEQHAEEKRQWIDKAVEWVKENYADFCREINYRDNLNECFDVQNFTEELRKEMKGGEE